MKTGTVGWFVRVRWCTSLTAESGGLDSGRVTGSALAGSFDVLKVHNFLQFIA
jgi:hypothetical protein